MRSGSIEVKQNTFSAEPALAKDLFLRDLQSALSRFTQILTAEFQIASMDAGPTGQLKTRACYELVGSGDDFHREQRVGRVRRDRRHPAHAARLDLK